MKKLSKMDAPAELSIGEWILVVGLIGAACCLVIFAHLVIYVG